MFRSLCAAAFVTLCAMPAGAAESKLGAILGQTKEGVVVGSVVGGSVADFMGLKVDDRIVGFRFTGPDEKGPEKVTDKPSLREARPLLDGRPGRYELVIAREGAKEPVRITGRLVERGENKNGPRVLVFVCDGPPKK